MITAPPVTGRKNIPVDQFYFDDQAAEVGQISTDVDRLAMNDWPLLDQLNDIAANHDDRIVINRRAGELTLNFGGDNVQANNFEKLVPAFGAEASVCRQRDN